MTLHFAVITLFPEAFSSISDVGITRRALDKNLITLQLFNPRDFTDDVHRTVDDKPYGGGPGMLMKPEPLCQAIRAAKEALKAHQPKVIYLSPAGQRLTQSGVAKLVQSDGAFIFIAGRYEGIDQRVIELEVDEEWSIGDYVLSGGELPAMVMIDAMTRLVPGGLGSEASAGQDSFSDASLLEHAQYTRPASFEGHKVPDVLLNGNHKAIKAWREEQSLVKTASVRPDLLPQKEAEK